MVEESNKMYFDSDRLFEFRKIRDIRVRDIEIRLYMYVGVQTPSTVVVCIVLIIHVSKTPTSCSKHFKPRLPARVLLSTPHIRILYNHYANLYMGLFKRSRQEKHVFSEKCFGISLFNRVP